MNAGKRDRKAGSFRGRGGAAGSGPGKPGTAGDRAAAEPLFGLGRVNLVLLGAGLVAIVVGYVLLDRGSITAAPFLLVLGYVVLIPAGLLVGMDRVGDGE